MSNVEKRLEALGITLPECPAPIAAYVPVQVAGDLIYVSGQTPGVDGVMKYSGKVGEDVTVEEAYEAAKICAVNCLSALKTVADLDSVRIIRVSGWVNTTPGFSSQPQVVNGASELMEAAFLEKGKHARSAVGVASLPGKASVEVEIIAQKIN